MANELFGKQAIEELKRSNQERKEKNRVVIGDTKVRLIPNNPILKILGSFFGVGALGTLFLWLLGTGTYRLLSKTNTIQIFESLKHMISPIVGFLFIIMIVCSVLFIIIWLFLLRPPRFDRWLKDIWKTVFLPVLMSTVATMPGMTRSSLPFLSVRWLFLVSTRTR